MATAIIRYEAHAQAFLRRARAALKRFDDSDDVSALLGAALELRLGIEARLHEYLRAELQSQGRKDSPITEYRATTLLRLLVKNNPRAGGASRLSMRRQGSDQVTTFHYTPVTPELAKVHGRLGGLLHILFFTSKQGWMVKARSEPGRLETALDARDLVSRGLDLLKEATRGTLLTNDVFGRAVRRAAEQAE